MANDNVNLWQVLAAFVLVLGLLMAFAFIMKWWAQKQPFKNLGNNRRLQIKESLMLDAKHRVVIFSRDEVEHVVIVSPERATLVERLP